MTLLVYLVVGISLLLCPADVRAAPRASTSTCPKLRISDRPFCTSFLSGAKPTHSTFKVTKTAKTTVYGHTTTHTLTTTIATVFKTIPSTVFSTQTIDVTVPETTIKTLATKTKPLSVINQTISSTQSIFVTNLATVTSTLATVTLASPTVRVGVTIPGSSITDYITSVITNAVTVTPTTTVTSTRYYVDSSTVQNVPRRAEQAIVPSGLSHARRRVAKPRASLSAAVKTPSSVAKCSKGQITNDCLVLLYGSSSIKPLTKTITRTGMCCCRGVVVGQILTTLSSSHIAVTKSYLYK